MSKNKIINARTAELARDIHNGKSITPGKMKHYSDKWNVSERTLERYVAQAKKLPAAEQGLEIKANGMLTELVRNPLLSNEELEAILCACAQGRLLAEKQIKINNVVERINCLPNHHDIIYAADRLLRLRNSADKKKITTNVKNIDK